MSLICPFLVLYFVYNKLGQLRRISNKRTEGSCMDLHLTISHKRTSLMIFNKNWLMDVYLVVSGMGLGVTFLLH